MMVLSNNLYIDFSRLKFAQLLVICFLVGCESVDAPSDKAPSVYIPEAPKWTEVPATAPLPLDGKWKNESGAIFLIRNGKGRALNSPSLDSSSVIFKDIQRVGPGKYTLNQLAFNSSSRKSNFHIAYMEFISRTEILMRLFANPVTHSRGAKLILTNVSLDNELLYLSEIDSAGLKENWFFSENTPEYSTLFLTENEDSTFSKKKTVFTDPKDISINFHNKPCIEKDTDWLVKIIAKGGAGNEVYQSSYDIQSISTQFEYLDNSCLSKTKMKSTTFQSMKPGEYKAILKVDKTFKSAVDFTILPN